MYFDHFGLLEPPFSIAPDPRYLYMSERHREALAHLLYGLESDGAFILLTGDVGTGKTTVSRCLLEQVPGNTSLAMVLNPKLSSIELLQVICDELRISYDASSSSIKLLIDSINRYLLGAHAQGNKTVVLIEEAQNLDLDVLEQLRLLTNLETNERKLLQVILLGQPEFLDVLDRPELSQLAQRITARFHLTPLKSNEVEEYIGHRLAIAGCRRPLFAQGVIKQIFKYSGGVPRLINVICDRALLGCYVQNKHQVDKITLVSAAKEVLGESKANAIKLKQKRTFNVSISIALSMFLLISIGFYFYNASLYNVKKSSDPLTTSVARNSALILELEASDDEQSAVINETVNRNFIQWPEKNRLQNNIQAYENLFNRWEINYSLSMNGSPCFYAQSQGLACLHEKQASLSDLKQINRPAILKLYDDFNQTHYVALLSLNDRDADIVISDQAQKISVQQLTFYWQGEFSLLWQQPPGFEKNIRPGDAGEIIVWLSKAINAIENKADDNLHYSYDDELVEQVKQLQVRQGLKTDGVVGIKTLIHINQLIGHKAPMLRDN